MAQAAFSYAGAFRGQPARVHGGTREAGQGAGGSRGPEDEDAGKFGAKREENARKTGHSCPWKTEPRLRIDSVAFGSLNWGFVNWH